MTAAGELREKIELQQQQTVSDGAGGSTSTWVTVVTARAAIRVLKAGEEVMQGRLASEQTLIVTLRYQSALASVDGTWKLKNSRTSKMYDIKAVTPDARKQWCDILAQTDVL